MKKLKMLLVSGALVAVAVLSVSGLVFSDETQTAPDSSSAPAMTNTSSVAPDSATIPAPATTPDSTTTPAPETTPDSAPAE